MQQLRLQFLFCLSVGLHTLNKNNGPCSLNQIFSGHPIWPLKDLFGLFSLRGSILNCCRTTLRAGVTQWLRDGRPASHRQGGKVIRELYHLTTSGRPHAKTLLLTQSCTTGRSWGQNVSSSHLFFNEQRGFLYYRMSFPPKYALKGKVV